MPIKMLLSDFPEGQFTQLGLANTHLLTLGFIESNAMIAGITGLGHIAITAGMIVFFIALRRAVTDRTPAK